MVLKTPNQRVSVQIKVKGSLGSVDRNNKTTLPRTPLIYTIQSYAEDLSPPIVKL